MKEYLDMLREETGMPVKDCLIAYKKAGHNYELALEKLEELKGHIEYANKRIEKEKRFVTKVTKPKF